MSIASSTARSPSHTFVSHSGEDKVFVVKFVDGLRSVGIDAWYSGYEIKAGDSVTEKMSEGLKACRFFILIVSKTSATSEYVKKEVNIAIKRKAEGEIRKIICVKLDGTDPPLLLQDLKWIDAQADHDAALNAAIQSILDVDLRTPLGKSPATIGKA